MGSKLFYQYLCFLAMVRVLGAVVSIILDCDEVYNYWEPLHYLLYGYGRQTWEYSPPYALRSYLYLLLHLPVLGPASYLFGAARWKAGVFFTGRAALGLASAWTEAWLAAAIARRHPAIGHMTIAALGTSAGMFFAAPSLLPSTFAMYCMTAATAAMLEERHQMVVGFAAIAVAVGWPVCAVAFIPYAVHILVKAPFLTSLRTLAFVASAALGLSLLADTFFYGRLTMSQWNFLEYNVVGGGDSALYGVEDALFYFRNTFNNFNALVPAAFLAPLMMFVRGDSDRFQSPNCIFGFKGWSLLLALFTWFAALSALPHKEERFLFVCYPLICVAASITLYGVTNLIYAISAALVTGRKHLKSEKQEKGGNTVRAAAYAWPLLTLLASAALSTSRIAALCIFYGAPIWTYLSIPPPSSGAFHKSLTLNVCVGKEWYRFPSSFFLPSEMYRIKFLDDGFKGLLPGEFNQAMGGASYGHPLLNNDNKEVKELYVDDINSCQVLVDIEGNGTTFFGEGSQPLRSATSDFSKKFEMFWSVWFLDSARSPRLYRAFYIPWLSQQRVVFGQYKLYTARSPSVGGCQRPKDTEAKDEPDNRGETDIKTEL